MFCHQLFFALVLSLSIFSTVSSSPSPLSNVFLETCDQNATISAVSRGCASICEPVYQAQEKCNRNLACTCTKAPPSVIQSCIQCNLNTIDGAHAPELWRLVPPRLTAYAQLCGDHLDVRGDVASDSNTTPTPNTRRDVGIHCVYGLPDVSVSLAGSDAVAIAQAIHANLSWKFFAFIFIAFALVAEKRRRSSGASSSA